MPKIPQFEATEKLQPNNMAEEAMNKEAYHDERTAEAIPHLIQQGSESIQRGFARMDDQQAQAQTAGMMQDMADLTVQSHQQLDTTLNTADPSSGVDPMTGFNESLQQKLQEVKDKYQNPKTQEVFSRMSAELQSNILDRGYSQWQGNVRSYTAQALDTSAQKFANAAALDPASVDDTAKQFGSAVSAMASQHAGMFSADDRNKLTRSGMESIYNSAGMQITHAINSNPNASLSDIAQARAVLAGDNFKNNMSPQDYNRVLDDLDKATTTRQDAFSIYIDKSAPQLLDQVRQFGDPDGKVGKLLSSSAVHTPEQLASAAVRTDDYNTAVQEHKVVQTIGNMPNDQVQQFIQARKANWQSAKDPAEATAAHGAYDMAVKVAKQRDEEFMKAPATYMLNHNDTVGALYAKYQQQPTPQNFQIYAAFSAGQQEKLYPGVSPNILTDDMKQDIGTRMASVAQDPQGALAAGQILSGTQKLTGQYWNQAAHELYKDHIVSPAQFASAQLLGSPKSWSLAQEGFRAASIPSDTLTTTSGISKEASDKVAADALRPLLATFADTADGHELVASYVDFASNIMRARGKVDPTTAAALAQTAVLDRFTIKNNLRIPNELDANDVADGGDNVLANIDQHKLVSPPSFSGAGEAVQGASYADDIKNFGHWSTNAKGDGMTLYDQYGAPVYENVKGGKAPVQVEIPFATAAKLGSRIRSPLNNAERIFTNPRSVPGLTGGPNKEDQAFSAEELAANPDGR
jgi:hypothetical protein